MFPRFSANGAASFEAWGNAPGNMSASEMSAESAIQRRRLASIPHVTFVKFDSILAHKLAVFFLKTAGAMMFLLSPHVFHYCIELTWAYRKRAITALPVEVPIFRVQPLNPFR